MLIIANLARVDLMGRSEVVAGVELCCFCVFVCIRDE